MTGGAARVLSETKELVERLEADPAGSGRTADAEDQLDEARRLLRAIVAEGGTLMLDAADLLRRSLVVDLPVVHGGRPRRSPVRPSVSLRLAPPPIAPVTDMLPMEQPAAPLTSVASAVDAAPTLVVAEVVERSSPEIHRRRPKIAERASGTRAPVDRPQETDPKDGGDLDALIGESEISVTELERLRSDGDLDDDAQALLTGAHDGLLRALRWADLDGEVTLVVAGLLRRVLALQLGHVAKAGPSPVPRTVAREAERLPQTPGDASSAPQSRRRAPVRDLTHAPVSAPIHMPPSAELGPHLPPLVIPPPTEVASLPHAVDRDDVTARPGFVWAGVTGGGAVTSVPEPLAGVVLEPRPSPPGTSVGLAAPADLSPLTGAPVLLPDPDVDVEPGSVAARRPRQVPQALTALVALRAVGVALVLFVLYTLYGSALTEGRAQRGLNPATHARISAVDVGLDQLVLGSDSRSALTKGPGLAPGSGVLGGSSPVVIVGHRTANGGPFRHLSALKPGEVIVVRATDGSTFRYDVERVVTTTPRATLTEAPGTQTLYLVSATPAYHDSNRLVVVARLVDAAQPSSPQSVTLPRLGGSSNDLLAAAVVLALLGWGWAVRTSRRRALPWWVVWVAWLPAIALAYLSWQLLLGSMSRLL